MKTVAGLFRETIKPDGRPERQLKQYEALGFSFKDPIGRYLNSEMRPGNVWRDKWGTLNSFPEGAPGKTPIITEENKVCPDITKWREYVHAPDIETAAKGDWSESKADMTKIRENGKLATLLFSTGIFEQAHFLMGIEDTLTNLYEHPQEMHELIDYILEYRLKYAELLINNLHPDAILSHDDWGTKTALFMQPDKWREFFKEPYRKLYSYISSQGVIVIHHADSYLVPIVEDMVEIGIQVWQGVLPENNIPQLLRRLDGRMTLMGGIGAEIDRADTTEEQARSYVRTVLEDCCPYGHFIPCITYGLKGTIQKHVDPYINAEIDKYNSELHFRNIFDRQRICDAAANNNSSVAVQTSAEASQKDIIEQGDVLGEISQAVFDCDTTRTLELCRSALEDGMEASTILDKGLVNGMMRIGKAFSEGRAFVPEMLLAAKTMDAALEELRPLLESTHTENNSPEESGKLRAVIGTIEGDLHDIGKNLVHIMMEGSGIEVIDLGSNVPAEDFINTAINENCNIIACSSLLSTTMGNMKKVVDLAVEAGIRQQVTIMVGGAPVSQEFCDEIGADIYTQDAGAAARAAKGKTAK